MIYTQEEKCRKFEKFSFVYLVIIKETKVSLINLLNNKFANYAKEFESIHESRYFNYSFDKN